MILITIYSVQMLQNSNKFTNNAEVSLNGYTESVRYICNNFRQLFMLLLQRGGTRIHIPAQVCN